MGAKTNPKKTGEVKAAFKRAKKKRAKEPLYGGPQALGGRILKKGGVYPPWGGGRTLSEGGREERPPPRGGERDDIN